MERDPRAATALLERVEKDEPDNPRAKTLRQELADPGSQRARVRGLPPRGGDLERWLLMWPSAATHTRLTELRAKAGRAGRMKRGAERDELLRRGAVTIRVDRVPLWVALRRIQIEALVDSHPMGAGWRPFRALARLASGDAVAARVDFQGLLASGLAPANRGVMSRTYLAGLAAVCVALRDREQAPLLYDRVAKRGDSWSVDSCHTLGPWALMLGELARLCGRLTEAEQHFETAIRLGRRMGSPVVVARAQSLLASLRLAMPSRSGERESVAQLLAEAGQELIRAALEAGGRDNASAVVVRVIGDS